MADGEISGVITGRTNRGDQVELTVRFPYSPLTFASADRLVGSPVSVRVTKLEEQLEWLAGQLDSGIFIEDSVTCDLLRRAAAALKDRKP